MFKPNQQVRVKSGALYANIGFPPVGSEDKSSRFAGRIGTVLRHDPGRDPWLPYHVQFPGDLGSSYFAETELEAV